MLVKRDAKNQVMTLSNDIHYIVDGTIIAFHTTVHHHYTTGLDLCSMTSSYYVKDKRKDITVIIIYNQMLPSPPIKFDTCAANLTNNSLICGSSPSHEL